MFCFFFVVLKFTASIDPYTLSNGACVAQCDGLKVCSLPFQLPAVEETTPLATSKEALEISGIFRSQRNLAILLKIFS